MDIGSAEGHLGDQLTMDIEGMNLSDQQDNGLDIEGVFWVAMELYIFWVAIGASHG